MQDDLEESIERVMAGPQRKSRVITKEEKSIIAYHESGHALLSLVIPKARPMHKVSTISRGRTLGYTLLPEKDTHLTTKTQMLAEIIVSLGGRVAEEMFFGDLSDGAYADLKGVSEIARNMVTQFGMSGKLGHITYGKRHENIFLGRDIHEERNYSDETARLIDQEIKCIVDECYAKAKETLVGYKAKLKLFAETLLEKEVMDDKVAKELLGLKENPHTDDDSGKTKKEA